MELDAEDLELLGWGTETRNFEYAARCAEKHERAKESQRSSRDLKVLVRERARDRKRTTRDTRNPEYWKRKDRKRAERLKQRLAADPKLRAEEAAYAREWRKKNPEKWKAIRARYKEKKREQARKE